MRREMFKLYEEREPYVIVEKDGGICRLTLNRPERLNAFTLPDIYELQDRIQEAEEDLDVKVIVLKGAGRAFCAGHDLSEVGRLYGWKDPKPGEKGKKPPLCVRLGKDRSWLGDQGIYHQIQFCSKFIIAQVHGYAIAGGFNLALHCDMTIATEDAKFGQPQQRMMSGGRSGGIPLILLIGIKKMRELMVLGKLVDGVEAERIGLVNYAVPVDKIEEEVEKVAKALELVPADSIAIGKAMTNLALERLGYGEAFAHSYIGHTLATNLSFREGEYNFIKERRDKGTRAAFKGRDARFKGLV